MKAEVKKRELEIILTLNEREATALLAVTGNIAGHPRTTSRSVFSGSIFGGPDNGSLDTVLSKALGFGSEEASRRSGLSRGSLEFGSVDED